MSDLNLGVARSLLDKMASGGLPTDVAELASLDLVFEVQGDPAGLPWIGETKHGRQALADFIRQQRELVQPGEFRVEDILSSADRAIIVGEFTSSIRSTGKELCSQFAIVLTISGGEITRFQMLEDSYAVSRAVSGVALPTGLDPTPS